MTHFDLARLVSMFKLRKENRAGVVMLARVVLSISAAVFLAGCDNDYCENGALTAAIISERFVKSELVAPSRASFQAARHAIVNKVEPCKFFVASYVDSQNGFGAMVRSRFTVTVIYNKASDSWSASGLAIYQ